MRAIATLFIFMHFNTCHILIYIIHLIVYIQVIPRFKQPASKLTDDVYGCVQEELDSTAEKTFGTYPQLLAKVKVNKINTFHFQDIYTCNYIDLYSYIHSIYAMAHV